MVAQSLAISSGTKTVATGCAALKFGSGNQVVAQRENFLDTSACGDKLSRGLSRDVGSRPIWAGSRFFAVACDAA